jgi:radical SAM protein (TIGR04043 family)
MAYLRLMKMLNVINLDTLSRKKARLQDKGLKIPPELLSELEAKYNAPSVKTGRLVFCLRSPEDNGNLIPVFIVNGKRVSKSPFHMVKSGSNYEIWEEDKKYTDIVITPHPEFYNRFTSDGVPMFKVAVIVAPGHARSVVNQKCFYQEIDKPCKFCAVQHWWHSNIQKTPTQVCETIVAGVEENVIKHASLTTATLNTSGKGLEGLVETARLISAKVKIPLMLEFEPSTDYSLTDPLLKEGKNAGVTTVFCNIECFDKQVREEVMPAKGKVETSTYVKTWEKCLDIFGKNEVYTVVVVGIGEDNDSILKGVEMAASHGVITFLVPHSPAIGAVFENMDSPGCERMLYLYKKAVDIYAKYGLDLWASNAGCARGGAFSAIKEVSKFGA